MAASYFDVGWHSQVRLHFRDLKSNNDIGLHSLLRFNGDANRAFGPQTQNHANIGLTVCLY
jgi:hypothetical protein